MPQPLATARASPARAKNVATAKRLVSFTHHTTHLQNLNTNNKLFQHRNKEENGQEKAATHSTVQSTAPDIAEARAASVPMQRDNKRWKLCTPQAQDGK